MSSAIKQLQTETVGAPAVADPAQILTEEQRQHQIELNQPTIALLRSWLEDGQPDSDEEQRAAFAWLKAAIDEDRPSDRKLFS
jgi:hypothetical protein